MLPIRCLAIAILAYRLGGAHHALVVVRQKPNARVEKRGLGWRSQVVYLVESSGVALPAALRLPLEVPLKTSRATRVLPRMNSKAPRTTTGLGCGRTKLEMRGAWRPREIAAPLAQNPRAPDGYTK
jgi:hypothetical protein